MSDSTDTSSGMILPEVLDLSTTVEFVNFLRTLPNFGYFIFDFSQIKKFEPFALLYLSFQIQQCRVNKPLAKFQAVNYTCSAANHYAAHMGFFRAFGLDYGKNAAEIPGNNRYIPITVIHIDELKKEADNKCLHVSEIVQKDSKRLAFILCQEQEGSLFDTLEYSLREMLRNVVEHSQAKKIYYCAQVWPSENKIEVAILDSGVGISHSLKSNPFLDIDSDKTALHLSLLPGVSGKMYKGKKTNRHDIWQNSGYGLYMTSELCRNGGSFFLGSGEAGLLLTHDKKADIASTLNGTILRLVFHTKNTAEISRSLKHYRDKGQTIAANIKGANINASAASSMLSKMLEIE